MKKLVFMGTPDFAVASLDAIVSSGAAIGWDVAAVVTVPDRQSGRGLKTTPSPVKEYALQHNIPVLQPEKLRDPEFLKDLRSIGADLFVVVAFRMLPEVVWSMPPLGTFNLHASLLPHYRGAAPINWAIINGEQQTGVTTFLLNDKIDEGKILLQRKVAIADDDNAGSLHDKLAETGSSLVLDTLRGLSDDTLQPTPQQNDGTLKPAPKIFKQDCLIDWHRNGNDVHNFIRGLAPYPAAFANFIDNKGVPVMMKIFDTAFENDDESSPGTIVTDKKNILKIGVNDGYIKILSLQLSGKKKINVDEFLRGYNITNWKLVE